MRSALKSAVVGRRWPQHRLWVAGLAASNGCALCALAEPEVDAPLGTPVYRVVHCPSLEVVRVKWLLPAGTAAMRAADAADGPCATEWITRAIAPSPAAALPPPPPESCTWHSEMLDYAELATATVYTDGSMIDGPPKHSALCGRLGWGIAVANAAGDIVATASGSPPPWIRTVPGAEMWALLQAAIVLGDAPTYKVDCMAVVQMYNKGLKQAASASSLFADILVRGAGRLGR